MGEFWTRYLLENGKWMSRRIIKKVMRLDEEILDCIISINHFEEIIRKNTEEINHMKNGGKHKQKNINTADESIF